MIVDVVGTPTNASKDIYHTFAGRILLTINRGEDATLYKDLILNFINTFSGEFELLCEFEIADISKLVSLLNR